MAETAKITIDADTKKAIQQIEKFSKVASESLKDVEKQTKLSSLAFANFVGGLATNAATSAFGAVAGAAKDLYNTFITEGVQAAIVQEDALNAVASALATSGEFSQEALQDFQNFASGLQSVTKFGDETILSQISLAKAFGATNEQAKTITEAAVNLAAATGKSLDEATKQVSKTLGGLAGELGEVNPAIKALTKEQLKAGEAARILLQQYGGAAANQVKTYSGALQQAKNAFGDLQEEVGFTITRNKAVIEIINFASKAFANLGTFVKDNREKIRGYVNELIALGAAVGGTILEIISQSKLVYAEIETLGTSIVTDVLATIDSIVKGFVSAIGDSLKVLNFKGVFDGAIASIDEFVASQNQIVQAGRETVAETRQQAAEGAAVYEEYSAKLAEFSYKIVNDKKYEADSLIEQENRKIEALKTSAEEQFTLELERQANFAATSSKQIDDELKRFETLNGVKANSTAEALQNEINYLDTLAIIHQDNANLLIAIDRKRSEDAKKLEDENNKERLKNQQTFFSKATSLTSSSSKELKAIGKAASLTQIAIDTPPAVASSFKFGAQIGGPVLGFVFGAIAAAAQAEQAKKVASLATGITEVPKGFPNDTFPANLTTGERVVSANQNADLKEFLDKQKSGTSSEQTAQKLDSGFGSVGALLSQMLNKLDNLENQVTVNIGNKEIFKELRAGLRQGRSLEV